VFSFGGIIAKGVSKTSSDTQYRFYFNKNIIRAIFLINFIILVIYFNKVKEITGTYTDLRMFRYYVSVIRVDIGIIKYCVVITMFSSILALISYLNNSKSSKITIVFIILMSFITTFLTGAKGSIFFLILSCLGVYSAFRKINVKLLLKVVTAMFLTFIILATILKKATPDAYSTNREYSAIEKLEYFLYSYSALPLSAFDNFYNQPYEVTYGDILFRFPNAVLYKIGLKDSAPKELVEKYVSVPDSVNVFTAYYKMIKDFGVVYSILLMFIIGFVHSYFFLNNRKRFIYLIGFSTLLFPLTMTFFEENYFSILSTWIQVCLYTIIANQLVIIENE